MNAYDKQYYIIDKANDDSLPSLTPDTNTKDRRFRYEKQKMESPPLIFFNGAKEYQKKLDIAPIKTMPNILFSGSNLMVCSGIREEILSFNIPHLNMHPAIYIHDDGKWHEDYWYMTFTEQFDCWDRINSTYEDEPLEMGGFKLYSIYTYSLDQELLDKIPLEQRLLFKMGGTQDGDIVCHESISHLFYTGDTCGSKLTLISDY
ncbi:hypothetical protein AAKU55_000544 [Oxalobacteraceae bacterium GrIS 1.11]